MPDNQRLQRHVRIGQRQDAERQAVSQITLDDPDAGQRPEQEQRKNAELHATAQQQPLVRGQPALRGDLFSADGNHRPPPSPGGVLGTKGLLPTLPSPGGVVGVAGPAGATAISAPPEGAGIAGAVLPGS